MKSLQYAFEYLAGFRDLDDLTLEKIRNQVKDLKKEDPVYVILPSTRSGRIAYMGFVSQVDVDDLLNGTVTILIHKAPLQDHLINFLTIDLADQDYLIIPIKQ